MSSSSSHALPSHLINQFKSIRKLYDQNQLKRALKQAESVLRLVPNHGETLSLKGLVLHALNRKQEALTFARRGVRHDVKNHLCWHILGILHRNDKNYLDAAVCFETGLALQKDDPEIIRDLIIIHIQNRNYDAFLKLTNKMLTLKPQIRSNWGAFAVAAHLAKEYETSLKVMDSYLSSIEQSEKERTERDFFEKSEALFYKVMVIEESGDIKRAKEELEKNKAGILDKEEWKTKRAELCIKLGEYNEAAEQYKVLLKGNPDNVNYYLGLLKSLRLVPETLTSLRQNVQVDEKKADEIAELCEKFAKENPYTKIPHQIPLSFLSGEKFKQKFQKFIFGLLTKGVPSLFMLVKHLYSDEQKTKIIEDVFLEVESNLLKINKLSPKEELEEPPTTILWTWYFLAEHFNLLHQTTKALEYAEKCKSHTPTVLDFELLRAKIYKNAGDVHEAALHTEEARKMDLADRYLNTKATRYFLRADEIKKAESLISIFTKVEADNSSYRNNIFDMQVVWYEFEEGQSWLRQKNYGMALKRFTDVYKHFQEIHSDQFDFHVFCHRKMTLRQYIRMLRFEDHLLGHQFYTRAARKIVEIYLHIHNNPSVKLSQQENELLNENLTEAEKKKLQRKIKKDKQKKEEEKKKATETQNKGAVDPDPNGEKLVNVSDPLAAANEHMKKLLQLSDNCVETHLLGYKLAIARKKYLQALRSVLKARSLAPNNPAVHQVIIEFFHTVSTIQNLHPNITKVIELEKQTIFGSQNLDSFNEAFFKENQKSVSGRRIYAQCALLLNGASVKKQLLPILLKTDQTEFSLNEFILTHQLLEKEFDEKSAQELKSECKELFPFATYFAEKKPEPTRQIGEPTAEEDESHV